MNQPAPPQAAPPRPTIRMVLAGIALAWDTAACAAIIADLALSGWHIEPSPLWSFVITAGAILTVSTVMVEVGARIVTSRQQDTDRIIARIDLLEERSAARYAVLNGIELAAPSGPATVGYPEGYADGLARRPAAPPQRRLSPVDS